MTTLRAALIQTRTPATQAASLEQLQPLVAEAAAAGAQLIATPEASNFLQKSRSAFLEQVTESENDPVVQAAERWARELGVWFLLGSALVRRPDGLFANRSQLYSPDGLVAQYDKIHMFDVDLPTGERHRESAVYAPGEAAVVAQTPWGGLGMSVCYDVRFPHLYRQLAKAGAAIITVPAAFTRPTGEAHWGVLLRARAIENGAFVLAPAQGGFHEDGRGTYGHSMIVAPWGEVLAQADGDEPGVILADLDLDAVGKARAAIPSLANERDFAAP
jgi:deaminated glutathione amidase